MGPTSITQINHTYIFARPFLRIPLKIISSKARDDTGPDLSGGAVTHHVQPLVVESPEIRLTDIRGARPPSSLPQHKQK
jgi:hypothetical protein